MARPADAQADGQALLRVCRQPQARTAGRFDTPELFWETADRIPGSRLALYQDKGHAGVITHRPAIREIIAFLRADQPARNP